MTPGRFDEIAGFYPRLRLAVVGDYCLDRYFEIDPSLAETSLETGLEVHNVVRVRVQPGAAGTILGNLCALGIGTVHAVGFCGRDGEGHLLRRALAERPGVDLQHFPEAGNRVTFTYSKPLVIQPGRPPRELNRIDQKNWTPTPPDLSRAMVRAIDALAPEVDAMVVLEQVDRPGTGAITGEVLACLAQVATRYPTLTLLADSRRGLVDYPPLGFKMNHHELCTLLDDPIPFSRTVMEERMTELAERNRCPVFVTLAEDGILGADPGGVARHVPALPPSGEIDVVGAGDAVTANLAAALAAGAESVEAMELAMAAAHVVVHQLGTTGSASREAIRRLLGSSLEP